MLKKYLFLKGPLTEFFFGGALFSLQASIGDGTANGTLSDRLNVKHRHCSKPLCEAWKTLPKRERKAIVAADRAIIVCHLLTVPPADRAIIAC